MDWNAVDGTECKSGGCKENWLNRRARRSGRGLLLRLDFLAIRVREEAARTRPQPCGRRHRPGLRERRGQGQAWKVSELGCQRAV